MNVKFEKMSKISVGDRVGLLVPKGWNDEMIYLIGYGAYVGNEAPPESYKKVLEEKWGVQKKVVLDDGTIFYESIALIAPEHVIQTAVLAREKVYHVKLEEIFDNDGNLADVKVIDKDTGKELPLPTEVPLRDAVTNILAEAFKSALDVITSQTSAKRGDFTLKLTYQGRDFCILLPPEELAIDPNSTKDEIKTKIAQAIADLAKKNPEIAPQLLDQLKQIEKTVHETFGLPLKDDKNPNSKLN